MHSPKKSRPRKQEDPEGKSVVFVFVFVRRVFFVLHVFVVLFLCVFVLSVFFFDPRALRSLRDKTETFLNNVDSNCLLW